MTAKTKILLALILGGESIFFLPFVLPRVFRPTVIEALEITNTELGYFLSAFGVVAMISYFFGGVLADLFSAKKLMSFALWLTAGGGVLMSLLLDPALMPWLYGFWALTSTLLFWSAMLKATKMWGRDDEQGRAFGWLEGGRGTIAAIMGTIAFFLFASSMDEAESLPNAKLALRVVVMGMSAWIALVGWIVWKWIPDVKTAQVDRQKTNLSDLLSVLKNRRLWLIALVIICGYVGYKMTDEFSQYARDILGFTQVNAALVGMLALWLRAAVALTSGWLGDKVGNERMILFGFIASAVGASFIVSGCLTVEVGAILCVMGLTATGLYTIRALYFAILTPQSAKNQSIPNHQIGTAIGFVSVMGYTPDIFVGPWMGHYLDTYPGLPGHQAVFAMMGGFALLGIVAMRILRA